MSRENNFVNLFFILIFIVILFYLLNLGANLLIPFFIALLFSFAIIGLSEFYKKIKIPSVFSMILSLLTYIFLFWLIGKMINSNVKDVINLMPIYQEKIFSYYFGFLNYFNITSNVDSYALLQKVNLTNIFSSVVSSIASIFSNAGLILFYTLFILFEYRYFGDKLNLMFNDSKKRNNA
ncbi:MAG: hypothetical protein NWP80_01235, partial [Candidatus Gracilibacteria bacterium]|nr:hypothetical protein [Candidatus Gracilibacteria bacterium]